jgi:Fe-S-cluster containining protein
METPTERKDFENIRWFMLHGHVTVFVDSGTWFLCVHNKCDHLRPDNLCGIYETRPQICRDYTTDKCEYDNDGVYDQLFETPDQIQEYADAILPPAETWEFSPEPPNPRELVLPLA